MVNAARPEPALGDLKAPALAEQHIRRRHPDIVEDHLGMAMRRLVVAENGQYAFDDDPGMRQRHQDHRLPAVAVRVVGIRLAHNDQHLAARVERSRGPPLRPLITYSLPSRRMRVSMLAASDEAISGLVIAKAERISPASNGSSQCRRCSAVP